ncbi:MAG: hypothetical protein WAM91_16915 [Candidatus Acidiferrales bacterium]
MNSFYLALVIPALVQFAFFAQWLHRRIRDDEIQRAFVRDMATNHLPHIYGALHSLARAMNVDLPEPPPLHFIIINGNNYGLDNGRSSQK